MEGWYHVTYKDIARNGGSGVMKIYGSSVMKMLKTVYPEYPSILSNTISKQCIKYYCRLVHQKMYGDNKGDTTGTLKSFKAFHDISGKTRIIKETLWINLPPNWMFIGLRIGIL
jgi:hypothetical protein